MDTIIRFRCPDGTKDLHTRVQRRSRQAELQQRQVGGHDRCRLGLPPNTLHRWRREAKLTGRAFPGHGKARDEELADIKKRLKQAELERDILKKAICFLQQRRSEVSLHRELRRFSGCAVCV